MTVVQFLHSKEAPLPQAAVNRRWFRFRVRSGIVGVVSLAATAGIVVSLVAGPAATGKEARVALVDGNAAIDATHLPPLLTLPGETIALRYDINCPAPADDPEAGCRGAGTVYIRPGNAGAFEAVPLSLDAQAMEGRYVAEVPPSIGSSPAGFTYYAVLRDDSTGATATLPAGGSDAPQQSLPLLSPTLVDLGAHRFGALRAADAKVAAASWGDGARDVGLEGGPHDAPIGASSFDVGPGAVVHLLDEAHKRVLRFGRGGVSALPLQIGGTLADMAVGPDGAIHVLESAVHGATAPLLRSFDASGRRRATWFGAERSAAAVRTGPNGPVTLEYPSSQWMPAAEAGNVLGRAAQARKGRVGRPLADGTGDVVVYRLRDGGELRLAVVGQNGVKHAWRILSRTPIGEVQLAQPFGGRLVVVFATYTDADGEFEALVLDGRGVAKEFAVPRAEWAEAAPLSRFRLAGSSLYQLGSTPSGVFVDRFDLGVK